MLSHMGGQVFFSSRWRELNLYSPPTIWMLLLSECWWDGYPLTIPLSCIYWQLVGPRPPPLLIFMYMLCYLILKTKEIQCMLLRFTQSSLFILVLDALSIIVATNHETIYSIPFLFEDLPSIHSFFWVAFLWCMSCLNGTYVCVIIHASL